ncbi:MAG: hypothetical protein AAF708_04910 [Deinococcota bacterium]
MKKVILSSLVMVAVSFGFGFAQDITELRQLQREARQLELLERLPEESRAEAEVLLTRVADLADSGLELRTSSMQVYVDALEAGEPPAVARELARQAVSEERLALTREMATLREDVTSFAETYPEAREIVRASRIGRGERGNREERGDRSNRVGRQERGNRGNRPERPGRSNP